MIRLRFTLKKDGSHRDFDIKDRARADKLLKKHCETVACSECELHIKGTGCALTSRWSGVESVEESRIEPLAAMSANPAHLANKMPPQMAKEETSIDDLYFEIGAKDAELKAIGEKLSGAITQWNVLERRNRELKEETENIKRENVDLENDIFDLKKERKEVYEKLGDSINQCARYSFQIASLSDKLMKAIIERTELEADISLAGDN